MDQGQKDKAIGAIKGIIASSENLLKSIGPAIKTAPCGSKKRGLGRRFFNPLKAAADAADAVIHDVSCAINSLSDVTSKIEGAEEDHIQDTINDVDGDIDDLKSIISTLAEDEDPDEDQSSKDGKSSDSKSCTSKSVTEDFYVACSTNTKK